MKIYKCDKCGKLFENLRVKIAIKHTNPMLSFCDKEIDLCNECYNKFIGTENKEEQND